MSGRFFCLTVRYLPLALFGFTMCCCSVLNCFGFVIAATVSVEGSGLANIKRGKPNNVRMAYGPKQL